MHAKIGADLGFVVLINIIYWHGSNVITIHKLTLFSSEDVKNRSCKQATSSRWRGRVEGVTIFLAIVVFFFFFFKEDSCLILLQSTFTSMGAC